MSVVDLICFAMCSVYILAAVLLVSLTTVRVPLVMPNAYTVHAKHVMSTTDFLCLPELLYHHWGHLCIAGWHLWSNRPSGAAVIPTHSHLNVSHPYIANLQHRHE